jgi:hypothetical protein
MQECLHYCAGRDAFGFVAQLKHEQGDEGPLPRWGLGASLVPFTVEKIFSARILPKFR